MSRFDNLAQWTGPSTSLRPIGPHVPVPEHDENSGRDDQRPTERIGAYGFATQMRQECEILLTTRSIATEAGALSFMAAGPHDVRPYLLLAMFGQDQAAILRCHRYAIAYLQAWCHASGVMRGEAAIQAAAADALAVMYGARHKRVAGQGTPGRTAPAADDRARSLGLRAGCYRELRNVALRMYRRRLQEACVAFHSGRITTHELPYLDIGRSPPPAPSSSRAAPRHGQQLSLRAA